MSDPEDKESQRFLPMTLEGRERLVREGFWPKLRRVVRLIPFAEDALAAYFCATDPDTPRKVKIVLLAALAYFVVPADLIPDFLLTFGFTDDAAVLTAAIAAISGAIKDHHREDARRALRGSLVADEAEV